MATTTTNDGTSIFYEDWGSGQPIVFSHGWPLNADAWDEQLFSSRPTVTAQSRMTAVVTVVRANRGTATTLVSTPKFCQQ